VAGFSDSIQLERTICGDGACPAYKVRVSGDGSIAWTGENFVEVRGTASSSMSVDEARALIQRAADRGFWALCTRYAQGPVSNPTIITTISIAGHVRSVQDRGDAAPGWLRAVDLDIDREVDTHRWRHGGPDQETFGADRLVVDSISPKAGVTRLMRVASSRRDTRELADMLADTSLEKDTQDSSGWNAVMYAAQAGTTEALRLLLQARADASRRSNEGETALAAAVSSLYDPGEKIRLLCAAGVDVNGPDRRGVTPLMLAARHPAYPYLIATLMQLGADPAKRDKDGRTARDYLGSANNAHPNPSAYDTALSLLTRNR
jgi:hypothetical protein